MITMKRILIIAVVAIATAACMSIDSRVDRARFGDNPYLEPPFYARYLDTRVALDQKIDQRLRALAVDPDNPTLHNELGALLAQKGFPNDAVREFKRAIYADDEFYPAWYNLGLADHARGNTSGAMSAFRHTIDLKPGHAAAHFQMGLIYEQQGKDDAAIDRYAKAFSINPNLLEVGVNPRILDTRLAHLALLKIYPTAHKTRSVQFQQAPRSQTPTPSSAPEAASRQERPQDIVTPAPPATEEGVQPAPPPPTP